VFRGVIGLAYPKAFRQSGLDPDTQTIPLVTETTKGQPFLEADGKRRTIVHFDLDPQNGTLSTLPTPKPPSAGTDMIWQVLVGDYDESEHAYAPIFKA